MGCMGLGTWDNSVRALGEQSFHLTQQGVPITAGETEAGVRVE